MKKHLLPLLLAAVFTCCLPLSAGALRRAVGEGSPHRGGALRPKPGLADGDLRLPGHPGAGVGHHRSGPPVEDVVFLIEGTGEAFTWIYPLHCVLLVGSDSSGYYFNDPLGQKAMYYPRAAVERAYAGLGS